MRRRRKRRGVVARLAGGVACAVGDDVLATAEGGVAGHGARGAHLQAEQSSAESETRVAATLSVTSRRVGVLSESVPVTEKK
jgi:hypothetical protein